jgi:hypothetical protein
LFGTTIPSPSGTMTGMNDLIHTSWNDCLITYCTITGLQPRDWYVWSGTASKRSAIHIARYVLEENMPIPCSKITDILNTLKLAIFSLYVIYVLRLIHILKYEIFFSRSKIGRWFGCISTGKQCFHHIHVPYAPYTIT